MTPTTLPLTLVATMEATGRGARSLATIAHAGGVGVYAEGDSVLQGVELAAVETGLVRLRNAGRTEILTFPREDKKKAKPGKTERHRKRRRWEIEGARDAVNCRDLDCTVERQFVDKLIARPTLLMKQGRARPFSRDGLKGFRVSRIRRGSLPHMLGLRTGDVVTSVNGKALDSMDGAMALYTRLRRAPHLTVEFTRNRGGERKEMELNVDIR